MIDQTALIVSCIQNRMKASEAPLVANPFCQTRKTEIPINIYRMVQTGPNAQLGGVYGGFFSPAYQFGIALKVNRLPMPAAAKQTRILTTSLMISLKLITGSLRKYSVTPLTKIITYYN